MNILFAPDFRKDNPYQGLLAGALEKTRDTSISFLSDNKRVLPLTRGTRRHAPDILHIHWPQPYFKRYHPISDTIRSLRFGLDLSKARGHCRFGYVITAHNILPHYDSDGLGVRWNMGQAYRMADAVICHSASAGNHVSSTYQVDPEKLSIIPHGDLSCTLPPTSSREKARAYLHIQAEEKVVLMFGAQAPYKGIEEVIRWWKLHGPDDFTLCLAGAPHCESYGRHLGQLIGGARGIRWENRYLNDSELANWLSACDATLFNYRAILTSGAACLARAYNCPILLPQRLDAIDLGEESAGVLRFNTLSDDSFRTALNSIPKRETLLNITARYRSQCSWKRVAQLTQEVYDSLVP